MTATDLDDPFATMDELAAEPPKRADRRQQITGGRYRLPNRDGSHKKGGWQRMTNRVSAFADQYGLRAWEIEQCLRAFCLPGGMELRQKFIDACPDDMTKDEKREWLSWFIELCKEHAKANEGTKFGNLRHSQVEAAHEDLPIPAEDAFARRHLHLYRSALIRHRLRAVPGMQERRVLLEAHEVVGTLDNVLEDLDLGVWAIGDLKTQKRFWTWLLVCAQLAGYANADAMWEPSAEGGLSGRWVDMPPVRKDIGLILWMPRDHPSGEPMVDVYEADLVKGLRVLELCKDVVEMRSSAKRVKEPWAWLRPAPPITDVERYAARFAAVDTVPEGRALIAEAKAKGVWCEVLADEAKLAKERLEKVGRRS